MKNFAQSECYKIILKSVPVSILQPDKAILNVHELNHA